jgi:hypothetical protein
LYKYKYQGKHKVAYFSEKGKENFVGKAKNWKIPQVNARTAALR